MKIDEGGLIAWTCAAPQIQCHMELSRLHVRALCTVKQMRDSRNHAHGHSHRVPLFS